MRAYQEINDRLEAAKAAAEARHASMRDALALMSHRAALLQQQLVRSTWTYISPYLPISP